MDVVTVNHTGLCTCCAHSFQWVCIWIVINNDVARVGVTQCAERCSFCLAFNDWNRHKRSHMYTVGLGSLPRINEIPYKVKQEWTEITSLLQVFPAGCVLIIMESFFFGMYLDLPHQYLVNLSLNWKIPLLSKFHNFGKDRWYFFTFEAWYCQIPVICKQSGSCKKI